IRMFSQLKAQIQKKVTDIQEAIVNGADYVAEMKTEREQGVKEINKTVTEGKAYIDSVITQAKTDLNNTKDDAIGEITTTSNNAKTSVTETADGVIKNINNVSNDATEHIDGKVDEFNGLLETEGFLTPEGLGNQLDELDWQKYKLTNGDGSRQWLGDITNTDITTLPTGLYEFSTLSDTNWDLCKIPNFTGMRTGHLASLDVTTSGNGRKQFTYRQNHYNRVFVATLHTSGSWREWKELTNDQSDTGWVTFDLINGAKSNTAFKKEGDGGFDCAYRIITNGSETKRLLRINGSNLVQNQVIAQLPSDFVKNAQTFHIRVPLKYAGAYIVLRSSGEVRFYINGGSSEWISTDYAYGQCQWID